MMKDTVLVDMGRFEDMGGWCLDTQFIVNMGVPYLLAHGLGTPVEDASTTVLFPSTGRYFIKVYTFNWVSPWTPEEAPGKFSVFIDSVEIKREFGTQGDDWCWQDGGYFDIQHVSTKLTLHDLTGFEGRCGLILFTKDKDFIPPTDVEELTEFFREQTNTKEVCEESHYDLVVCGGGIAGICTALSAARQGVKTALVQDRNMVGGNNSSEVRVWLGGKTNFEPYPGVGNIINELEQKKVGHYGATNKGENYEDDNKLKLLLAEKNITLYLSHVMTDVEVEKESIKSVCIWDIKNNMRKRLTADFFSDSTGDSTLGFLAGADYEVTTNGHMGMSNLWYVEKTSNKTSFPHCPWAIDLSGVDFPGKVGVDDIYGNKLDRSLGCWFWESGCELDPIDKAEYARDLNFRAMYGAWDCIKNVDLDYNDYTLAYCSYIGGKRESRRLFGDVVLTKSEVSSGKKYLDGCVPSTWNFDVHYPDRRFYEAFRSGDGFLTKDYHEPFNSPYFIPYRCLYSRNIDNLWMAGRNVSVSHDALGTVRVMRTGGMMGEVIGIAASICKEKNCTPRAVYELHLDEFIQKLKNIPIKKLNPLVSNIGAQGQ